VAINGTVLLNPPLERIIHQLARLAQLASPGGVASPHSAAAIAPAAQAWAGWLVQHSFANATEQDELRTALTAPPPKTSASTP